MLSGAINVLQLILHLCVILLWRPSEVVKILQPSVFKVISGSTFDLVGTLKNSHFLK